MTKDEKTLAEITSQNILDKKEFEKLLIEADRAIALSNFRELDEILKKFKMWFEKRTKFFNEKLKGCKLKACFNQVNEFRKEDETRKKEIKHYLDNVA